MAATMTISLRVSPELRERLERAAAGSGLTMSALAVALIREGLDGGEVDGDGPLVQAVGAAFADLEGRGVAVERQTALSLARIAQAGGMAAVSALRELRPLMAGVLDDDGDEWLNHLAEPE